MTLVLMDLRYYVYCLIDPTMHQVRYVGYSKNPTERYRIHLRDSCNVRRVDWDSHKCRWIRSLLDVKVKPCLKIVCILQTCEEAQRVEVALIALLNRRGADLTNGTVGGDGGRQGAEARMKMRLAKLGKKQDPKHVDARREKHRIGANRRFEDPEQRRRQAEITRAQWADPTARAKKMAAIQIAKIKISPETRSNAARIGGLASQAKRRSEVP